MNTQITHSTARELRLVVARVRLVLSAIGTPLLTPDFDIKNFAQVDV